MAVGVSTFLASCSFQVDTGASAEVARYRMAFSAELDAQQEASKAKSEVCREAGQVSAECAAGWEALIPAQQALLDAVEGAPYGNSFSDTHELLVAGLRESVQAVETAHSGLVSGSQDQMEEANALLDSSQVKIGSAFEALSDID